MLAVQWQRGSKAAFEHELTRAARQMCLISLVSQRVDVCVSITCTERAAVKQRYHGECRLRGVIMWRTCGIIPLYLGFVCRNEI